MDLSFEQMYQQLSEKHRPQLEAIRKSIVRKLWFAGFGCTVVTALLLFVLPETVLMLIGIFFLVWLPGAAFYFSFKGLLLAIRQPPTLKMWASWILCIVLAASILGLLMDYMPFVEFIIPAASLIFIGLFCYMIYLKRPYVLYFRETVAKNFVALADPSLSYSPEPTGNWHNRILNQYHTAGFEGTVFHEMVPVNTAGSPGLSNFITGEIEDRHLRRPFWLCCMSLSCEDDKTAKFKGLCISMKVSKRLKGFIKVQRRWGTGIFGSFFIPGDERQKIYDATFEKNFLVGSNDQITAMQYLTADVMELLLNFKDELVDIQTRFSRSFFPQNPNAISLDFFWQDNDVLMRIGNKKMFKPTMRDPMCKDSLACCLSSLRFATRLNQVIAKSIKETAI